MILPSRLFGRSAPSNRLQLGFIGLGEHGTSHNLANFLSLDDCRAVAVCDVYRDRMARAATMVDEAYDDEACESVGDFRDILSDPKIDAVVISTPDHWHVPMALMALDAGKHVFCEKPTYTISEGRELVEAVTRSGLIFSTGLEDRSLTHYHKLIEWLRNGEIGDLYHVDVTLPPGNMHPKSPEVPVPDGLDWEMWLGPAPFHPFTETRAEPMHWRYIRDYSTGVITDWGTHIVDTAQLAVNDPNGSAVEVKAWGAPVPPGYESDIPANYEIHYRYANGVTMAVKSAENEEWKGAKAGIKLLGSKGWVSNTGWRGRFEASDGKILRARYDSDASKHWPRPPGEHRNFLDSVRSGSPPTYPADTLHLLCTTLHMGLIAMDLGRPLNWDPSSETFIGDPEANDRLTRKVFREDWKKS